MTRGREEDDFYQRVARAQAEADLLEAQTKEDEIAEAQHAAREKEAEEAAARAKRAEAMEAQAASRRAHAERSEASARFLPFTFTYTFTSYTTCKALVDSSDDVRLSSSFSSVSLTAAPVLLMKTRHCIFSSVKSRHRHG